MLVSMKGLLHDARASGYAVGAFNIYNLEGVLAVIGAAEAAGSPVILQIHPAALAYGSQPLLALCLAAARESSASVGVHLDHSSSAEDIRAALGAGVTSIMADGSHLPYRENIAFTREMTTLAHSCNADVEAELGRLAGTEDGLTVHEYEAHLTNPREAAEFVAETGIDALAVCIGNVHGQYRTTPTLDFDRLEAIQRAVAAPLVLHGASGLPEELVRRAISLGICKLNVNTELRAAFVAALRDPTERVTPDLVELLMKGVHAMQEVAATKIRLFQRNS